MGTSYPYELASFEQRQIGTWWWWIHHQVPCEMLTEPIERRVAFIRAIKPAHEQDARLRALQPVQGPLPLTLVEVGQAFNKARQARIEAGQVADEAWRVYDETRRSYEPELRALLETECPATTWDANGLVFPAKAKLH